MSLLNLFRRRGTAPVARERLQVLLAYERATRGQPNLLALLREEILARRNPTVWREMQRQPNSRKKSLVPAHVVATSTKPIARPGSGLSIRR